MEDVVCNTLYRAGIKNTFIEGQYFQWRFYGITLRYFPASQQFETIYYNNTPKEIENNPNFLIDRIDEKRLKVSSGNVLQLLKCKLPLFQYNTFAKFYPRELNEYQSGMEYHRIQQCNPEETLDKDLEEYFKDPNSHKYDEPKFYFNEQQAQRQEIKDQEIEDQEIEDQEIRDREIRDREIKDREIKDREIKDREKDQRIRRRYEPYKISSSSSTASFSDIIRNNVKYVEDYLSKFQFGYSNIISTMKISASIYSEFYKTAFFREFINNLHFRYSENYDEDLLRIITDKNINVSQARIEWPNERLKQFLRILNIIVSEAAIENYAFKNHFIPFTQFILTIIRQSYNPKNEKLILWHMPTEFRDFLRSLKDKF